MCNQDMRYRIRRSGFRQYEIAKEMGITPGCLCCWMREPLTAEKKNRILKAIKELRKKQKEGAASGAIV